MILNLTDCNQRELSRFLKFSVVGVIGAVVDFGSFNLFAFIIGIPSLIAQTLSFTAAVTSNFIWNRFWTYPDARAKTVRRQAVQFTIISMLGLIIRTVFIYLTEMPLIEFIDRNQQTSIGDWLTGWVPPGLLNSQVLGGNLTLALAVILVMFWNFFANRYWTYSEVE